MMPTRAVRVSPGSRQQIAGRVEVGGRDAPPATASTAGLAGESRWRRARAPAPGVEGRSPAGPASGWPGQQHVEGALIHMRTCSPSRWKVAMNLLSESKGISAMRGWALASRGRSSPPRRPGPAGRPRSGRRSARRRRGGRLRTGRRAAGPEQVGQRCAAWGVICPAAA
jgi:hypothetical protein